MGQKNSQTDASKFLLEYEELVKIVPELEEKLSKEEAFEFSKQLYEFTKLIFQQSKNEKTGFIT